MKKLLTIASLVLVVILPLKGELAVNIGGFYSGAFKIDSFSLNTYFKDSKNIVSFDETNVSAFNTKSNFGFNAGVSYFFNYKIGIGLNASFIKTSVDVRNSFDWSWKWWDGEKADIKTKYWKDNGTITTIPVSINLIFRVVSTDKVKVNLFAGPTLFLNSVKLDGNGGYADGPILHDKDYIVDWYDIPLKVSSSTTMFGGNGGFEIEYMLSETMNIFLSATYYYANKLTLNWKVKTGQYTSESGLLIANISNSDLLPDYNIPINISTYSIGFGIKLYL